MKAAFYFVVLVALLGCVLARPAPADEKTVQEPSKSAFGPAFDEIVVESSLTVRRKTDPVRQSRTNRNKRQIGKFPNFPNFPAFPSAAAAQAGAQAQDFNAGGPLGSFGASATGTQTQTLTLGQGGIAGAGGFSMTQQYRLPNGQVLNFSLGNTFSNANGNIANGQSQATSLGG